MALLFCICESVYESDIFSTTVVVEHQQKRRRVRDTDIGSDIQNQIDDLKLLLLAYRKGLIKEM